MAEELSSGATRRLGVGVHILYGGLCGWISEGYTFRSGDPVVYID